MSKTLLELACLADRSEEIGILVTIGETRSLSAVTHGYRFETLGNTGHRFDRIGTGRPFNNRVSQSKWSSLFF